MILGYLMTEESTTPGLVERTSMLTEAITGLQEPLQFLVSDAPRFRANRGLNFVGSRTRNSGGQASVSNARAEQPARTDASADPVTRPLRRR